MFAKNCGSWKYSVKMEAIDRYRFYVGRKVVKQVWTFLKAAA